MLPRLRQFLLLCLSILFLVTTGAIFYQHIGQLLIFLYTQTMPLIMPDSWYLVSLELTQQGHEKFISARIETQSTIYIAGQFIPAGLGMNGSTLLSHGLLPLLVMLPPLFAWSFLSKQRIIGPLLAAFPLLLLVESLDVPFVLVGSLWDILYANFAPDSPLPWQVGAMDLLNGGGRQAISLAAGFVAISLGSKLQLWYNRRSLTGKSIHTSSTA